MPMKGDNADCDVPPPPVSEMDAIPGYGSMAYSDGNHSQHETNNYNRLLALFTV